tara:strand:- start:622 stop:1074 length:453 start_codon:yes stop_codon:yes gene_type:complete
MKKIIFLLTLLIGFISCSDDDDRSSENSTSLVGEWKLKSHVVNGNPYVLNDCDKTESLSFTETNLTHREYEDNQCGYTECTLTEYDVFSYSINDDLISLNLLNSMEYCSDPNGVDNTSTNPNQSIVTRFSVINGEIRYGPDAEYWIYERN